MKNKFLIAVTAAICVLITICAFAGQGVNQVFSLTSPVTPAWLQTNSSTAGTPVQIPQGVDLGFYLTVQSTPTNNILSTAPAVFGFDTSPDGVLYTTTQPISVSVNEATNGVANTLYWNVNRTNLVGAKYIRWDTFSTLQTNPVAGTASVSWVQ